MGLANDTTSVFLLSIVLAVPLCRIRNALSWRGSSRPVVRTGFGIGAVSALERFQRGTQPGNFLRQWLRERSRTCACHRSLPFGQEIDQR